MKMPLEGSDVTAAQVNGSINIDDFKDAKPGEKAWHYGLFEPWALKFGYPEGTPLYGSVSVSGEDYHIYYLNDGNECTIILKKGETPETYKVEPKSK